MICQRLFRLHLRVAGLYVWRPVPPNDLYVAIGAVCTTEANEPRHVDVRCVPRAWLVRGDMLGAALWSLGDRHEVKVQEGLGGRFKGAV